MSAAIHVVPKHLHSQSFKLGCLWVSTGLWVIYCPCTLPSKTCPSFPLPHPKLAWCSLLSISVKNNYFSSAPIVLYQLVSAKEMRFTLCINRKIKQWTKEVICFHSTCLCPIVPNIIKEKNYPFNEYSKLSRESRLKNICFLKKYLNSFPNAFLKLHEWGDNHTL